MGYGEETSSGSGKFRARYRDGNRQLRTVTQNGRPVLSTTRAKAKKLADLEEAKVRAGQWFDSTPGRITFAEYFENHWLPNRAGEINTLGTHQGHYQAKGTGLKAKWGDTELRRITPSSVQGWVTELTRAGLSPRNIAGRVHCFQTVLAAHKGCSAVRDKLIDRNPCEGVELPHDPEKDVEIFLPDEVDAVIAVLPLKYKLLAQLAIDLGVRWGELMGMQLSAFTADCDRVTIRRTVIEPASAALTGNGTRFAWKEYPKNKKQRSLQLSDTAAAAVREQVVLLSLTGDDRLFPALGKTGLPVRTSEWPEGLPISRAHFRTAWRSAVREAGVRPLPFKQLRATNISWMLAGGADLPTAMHRAGHSQFKTTQKYTSIMPGADQKAMDAIANVRRMYAAPVEATDQSGEPE